MGYFLSKEPIKGKINLKDNIEGWTPLAACCTSRSSDQIAVAKRLLKAKADIDVRDNRGRTPLMLAIICDNLELAEELIDYGASLDKRDRATWMPLHHAAFDKSYDGVKILLQNGSRYYKRDQLKMRAIDWAERRGHTEIAGIIKTWSEKERRL